MQSAQIRMTTLIDYTSKVKNYIIKPLGDMHMGDGIFDQPDGTAAGCNLAAGQGTEFEICDPGLGVWVNDGNIIWNEKKQDNGR